MKLPFRSISTVFRVNSMSKNPADIISEKIKACEAEFDQKLHPGMPFIVRLDGCTFRNYTSGMTRPFDPRLTLSMMSTMNDLVENTGAIFGFTQSDEISLVFRPDPILNNYPYNGRVSKIQSVYAGMASTKFNHYMRSLPWDDTPERVKERVMSSSAWFDARCFSVPDHTTAMEAIFWRHKYDCRRNAIHTVAISQFDPKSLHGMSLSQLIELLEDEKHIRIFSDIPKTFLYGIFAKKMPVSVSFTNPVTGESGIVLRSRLQNRVFDMRGSSEERTEMVMSKNWEPHHQITLESIESVLPVHLLPTPPYRIASTAETTQDAEVPAKIPKN